MKHNSYANGGLQNIEFNDNGVDKTVGVVEPGNYTFTPDREETIECLTGSLEINNEPCLPGQKIVVKSGAPFAIVAKEASSYICSYR